MLSNYRLYNNEINQEDFERWCSPFGIDVGQYEEQVMPYNKTYNKINVLLGEELKRGDSYRPVLLSQKDIIDKTEELKRKIAEYVDSELEKEIVRIQAMRGELQPEEAEQIIGQLKSEYTPETLQHTEFRSQKEIFASKVLQYARYDQELRKQKNFGFKHCLLSDLEVVWVGVDRDKPTIKMINPLYVFFQKSPDVEYIQDGDFAGHRTVMTRQQAFDRFGDDMTPEQVQQFERPFFSRRGAKLSKDIRTFYEDTLDYRLLRSMYSYDYITESTGQHASDYSYKTTLDLVEVVHAEWKTLRKVYFLTYFNEFNEEIVDVVGEEFPMPEEATRVKIKNKYGRDTNRWEWVDEMTGQPVYAEEIWIPRVWEGYRIEGDIYVNVREKPNQPLSIEDPYRKTKLGYHGLVYTSTNANSIAPMSRMKPFQYLYFVAMHQLSKLLARNQGKQLVYDQAQLPSFNDPYGRTDEELFLYYQSLGVAWTNSMANTQGGSMPPNRGNAIDAIDVSTTVDMMNLTQLCYWLDEQIGAAIGITQPREGAVSPNTNVTDNQQSITQSSHITEFYFNRHNELWRHILTSYLDCFTQWAKEWFRMNPNKKEFFLQYVLDNGSIQMLKITPDYLDNSDFGIFIEIGSAAEEYRMKMEQLMLPLVQNQMQGAEAVSEILKARRDGTSPEEIHRMIKTMASRQEQQMAQSQEQQAQMLQQQAEQEAQLEQMRHQNKLAEIELQEQLKTERDIQVATIRAMSWDPNKDVDRDGMPDVLEVARAGVDAEIKMRDMKLKEQKFAQESKVADKKLELEEKKIQQQKTKSVQK